MSQRVPAWGMLVIVAALGPRDAAAAGQSHVAPPVPPVVLRDASGHPLEPDDLPGPPLEIVPAAARLDLPEVPGFTLPAPEPGFHAPRELRVHGAPLLGTAIQVKGYVTAIYDCATELAGANPRATRAQIAQAIDQDPTLCERPMIFLGDTPGTSRDASIWVVEVPPPRKPAPRLAVGDFVVVTGTWAQKAPHAEYNPGGLLVYQALAHVAPPASPPASVPQVLEMEIEIAGEARPPLRRVVDEATRAASVEHLNACNAAIAARHLDDAVAACAAATAAWDGNHLACYATASAHLANRAWAEARDAAEHAVTMRPDQPMYQLYLGIARYEAERQQARDVAIDPAGLRLDAARDALVTATRLAPALWRAHYYLGRLYRDLDDPRHAAQQFTRAIQAHPGYRFSYIALIELYRRWDYLDQARAVARLGTAHVPAAEAADLWFEAGVAHAALHDDDRALDAFTRAIATRPEDADARLQRGQLYLRKGELDHARRDLEDVVAAAGAPPDARQRATQLLAQIANHLRAAAPSETWGNRKIYRRPFYTWQDAARSRVQ